MTAPVAGWLLLGLAIGLLLTGAPQAAALVALAAAAVVLTEPDPERADARRRNQARRRGWHR
jgi:hypothetical protein